jgi:hypothetical protein
LLLDGHHQRSHESTTKPLHRGRSRAVHWPRRANLGLGLPARAFPLQTGALSGSDLPMCSGPHGSLLARATKSGDTFRRLRSCVDIGTVADILWVAPKPRDSGLPQMMQCVPLSHSPLLWKLYMPAIGKFRPALRSMGSTAGDFIKQRPAQPQSEFDLPEYAASGDLILPRTFNAWIFVGSPLTPTRSRGIDGFHVKDQRYTPRGRCRR